MAGIVVKLTGHVGRFLRSAVGVGASGALVLAVVGAPSAAAAERAERDGPILIRTVDCHTPVGVGCGISFTVAEGLFTADFEYIGADGAPHTSKFAAECWVFRDGELCPKTLYGYPELMGPYGQGLRWTVSGTNTSPVDVFPFPAVS